MNQTVKMKNLKVSKRTWDRDGQRTGKEQKMEGEIHGSHDSLSDTGAGTDDDPAPPPPPEWVLFR